MKATLEQELTKLKQGDHICSIYEKPSERLAVAVRFIVDGLARRERCIYIVDDSTVEEVLQALTASGVDVVEERQRGALRVLTRQDTCLRAGEFVPQAMIEVIRQAEAEALADGFSGLRQMGEMTWVLGPEPGCDRLIEFEALFDQSFKNSKTVGMCHFNRSRFDAPFLHDVFLTHPVVILGDRVCPNPYYLSPEMVLSKDQAVTTSEFKARQVEWWIAQLERAKTAEQERDQLVKRLQTLSRRLLEVQEEERGHLARELHDEFGQIITAITLYLHAARGLAGDAARPRLDECAKLLQQAGEQVRSLALELRPPMLETLGVEATLRWLAEQHQQRTGCAVKVVGHLSEAPLTPDLAIACFRVAQEALTNVVRHAAARHVWIELSQSESEVELVVEDDGEGFDVVLTQEQAARRGSLGLLGMAERVHLLGGLLQVESEPGRGTRIRASFPLSEVIGQPADMEVR
jgi:signal transduction histidine kinase